MIGINNLVTDVEITIHETPEWPRGSYGEDLLALHPKYFIFMLGSRNSRQVEPAAANINYIFFIKLYGIRQERTLRYNRAREITEHPQEDGGSTLETLPKSVLRSGQFRRLFRRRTRKAKPLMPEHVRK